MNELEHLEDFEQILASYNVSPAGQKILRDTTLVLCCAPTATGRNTIIRELLKTGRYYFIVSDTTRKPRTNDGVLEHNGVEYWFRSEQDMLQDLRAGLLVEAAVIHGQQVSGMSIREINKACQAGKIGITDIEVVGVANVVKAKPDTICLFFLPPSFEEWQRRITTRGDMNPAELKRRLQSAKKELETALANDYYTFVINDNLDEAVSEVKAIVADPANSHTTEQVAARTLAEDILAKTKNALQQ